MSEPTTAAERREMREEARAADRVAEEPMAFRGGKRGPLWIEDARGIEVLLAPQEFGACVRHSYAARPSRLLALLDEHEAQAAEIERLRAELAVTTLAREKVDGLVASAAKVARLEAEQSADRAAVRRFMRELGTLLFMARGDAPQQKEPWDAHAALLERMATWGEVAPQPQSEPVNPRWGAALAREADAFARYKDPKAQRDAEILRAAAKLVRTEQEARLILEALGWSNSDAVERVLRGDVDGDDPGPPRCNGEWLSGSGGHRMFGGCHRGAAFRDGGSDAGVYFCEEHVGRLDPEDREPIATASAALPPEPDDEQSAYDAEVAERMGGWPQR
jgi:hypothetical protein